MKKILTFSVNLLLLILISSCSFTDESKESISNFNWTNYLGKNDIWGVASWKVNVSHSYKIGWTWDF